MVDPVEGQHPPGLRRPARLAQGGRLRRGGRGGARLLVLLPPGARLQVNKFCNQ